MSKDLRMTTMTTTTTTSKTKKSSSSSAVGGVAGAAAGVAATTPSNIMGNVFQSIFSPTPQVYPETDWRGGGGGGVGTMMVTKPAQEGFTVYTRSGCEFCRRAKQLLSSIPPSLRRGPVPITVVECDEYVMGRAVSDVEGFWDVMCGAFRAAPSHRTFPVIFLDKKFIGGYTETLALLRGK